MHSQLKCILIAGLYAEISQRGRTGDIFFKRGGGGRSCKQCQGETGRQYLKISLVILRGARLTQGGGGGQMTPMPPKYTPGLLKSHTLLLSIHTSHITSELQPRFHLYMATIKIHLTAITESMQI